MLYRRKVILALLQAFGGELAKTDFQKLLFIFTRMQQKPAFDFVPYRFGCYSFQAEADRRGLVKQGRLAESERWKKIDEIDYIIKLTPQDRQALNRLVHKYKYIRGRDLVAEVYRKYPYYAIYSEVVDDILDSSELKNVESARPRKENIFLLTIGYEGLSLEAYLNRLLQYDIRVLCDVRRNPISRKFGFSKSQLKAAVEKMGMLYMHIPELGIASGKRKALSSPSDYTALFEEYERTTLHEQAEQIKKICRLVEKYERVALTCFEHSHKLCHRSYIANALTQTDQWKYEVLHI
ncbi:MAG: DUF488 domain-containing protein [Bacteroidetes bacterium]|nr:MAG: DUF488 domain-containing protein [Bacteroidota bacterium]